MCRPATNMRRDLAVIELCTACNAAVDQGCCLCPGGIPTGPFVKMTVCTTCNRYSCICDPNVQLINPKDAVGSSKLGLHLVPDTLSIFAAMAFTEGATKYGPFNWRVAGIRASIYRSALERHLKSWWNGEECDPGTGVPHLASAIACLGIIMDAQLVGKLDDDRPPIAPIAELIRNSEGLVKSLITLHADKNPKNYTQLNSGETV